MCVSSSRTLSSWSSGVEIRDDVALRTVEAIARRGLRGSLDFRSHGVGDGGYEVG